MLAQTTHAVQPVAPVFAGGGPLNRGPNPSITFGEAVRAKATTDFHTTLADACRTVAEDVEFKQLPIGFGKPWLNGHPHCAMGHVLHRMGIPPIETLANVALAFADNGLGRLVPLTLAVQRYNDITQPGLDRQKREGVATNLRALAALAQP